MGDIKVTGINIIWESDSYNNGCVDEFIDVMKATLVYGSGNFGSCAFDRINELLKSCAKADDMLSVGALSLTLTLQEGETLTAEHVDDFAAQMKAKLNEKGGHGWSDNRVCSVEYDLQPMLIHHIDKGDMVDVANIAMMIFHKSKKAHERGQS